MEIDLTIEPKTLFDTENCPVCYESFTTDTTLVCQVISKVVPKVVPKVVSKVVSKVYGGYCGHVICNDCFTSLQSYYSRKTPCPICREEMIVQLECTSNDSDVETEEGDLSDDDMSEDEEGEGWLDTVDYALSNPARYPHGGGRCLTCRENIPRVTYHGCLCTHPPLCTRCYEAENDCDCVWVL